MLKVNIAVQRRDATEYTSKLYLNQLCAGCCQN